MFVRVYDINVLQVNETQEAVKSATLVTTGEELFARSVMPALEALGREFPELGLQFRLVGRASLLREDETMAPHDGGASLGLMG